MTNDILPSVATTAQTIGVLSACWAIISGIGAWKREFIGKRKIELAEQVLAKFFEVRDAIAFIRNPFGNTEEGKTRKRNENETPDQSKLLDQGYVVFERHEARRAVFVEFNALKYRFMASFGKDTEEIFVGTNQALNSIMISARMLSTHYWQRQGRVGMSPEELKAHLTEMHKHEDIFWETGDGADEILVQLDAVQIKLEAATAPVFAEPISTYTICTKKWFR